MGKTGDTGMETNVVDPEGIAEQVEEVTGIGIERSRMIVGAFKEVFVAGVFKQLASLTMRELVTRKNPCLYLGTGASTCEEYVQQALQEYVDGVHGDCFGHFLESVAEILSEGKEVVEGDDGVRKMASKDFWAEMSGDADFYVKLLDVSAALSPMFQADMESPYERLLAEAHELFCEGDAIRWGKVIRLVSG